MKIKLTENKLKQIVTESVKNILSEARKPKDAYFGGYFFEGIGFDRNGNPIYSSKHLPIEVMDVLGWRKSSKWGRCGYATDWDIRHALKELDLPFGNDEEEYYNSLNEAISPDYRSALKQLFAKSFGNLDDNEKQYLYDLLSNETWETVYVALEMLKPYSPNNEVNEGKTVNHKPIFFDHDGTPIPPGGYVPTGAGVDPIVDKKWRDFLEREGVVEPNLDMSSEEYMDALHKYYKAGEKYKTQSPWYVHSKRKEKYDTHGYKDGKTPLPNYDRDAEIRRFKHHHEGNVDRLERGVKPYSYEDTMKH